MLLFLTINAKCNPFQLIIYLLNLNIINTIKKDTKRMIRGEEVLFKETNYLLKIYLSKGEGEREEGANLKIIVL